MRRFNNTLHHSKGFVLVGFSEWPKLEMVVFVAISIFYIMTLLGNSAIIILSRLDPRLHTPMYFFLANLSFLDLCYTTSTVPQMLVNIQSHRRNTSYGGCIAQLFIFLGLGSTECVLLSVMAFDRYVAICQPLHYSVIMHSRLCQQLAAVAWVTGFSNSLVQTVLTFLLPRCGQYQVENFFCEVPAMLQLSCVDTWINEVEMYAAVVVIKVIPVGLILFSYINIVRSVVRIQSSEGRKKAFNTCGSHLLVVVMFYGSAISGYAYMAPKNNSAKLKGKLLALFYGLVTPMLNPLIYTLRNKDVKEAVKKLLGRELEQGWMEHGLGECSVQFSSVAQLCPTLHDPMNCSTPGLPVHHQLPEFTQTHVHRVSDAIQPSHPLSSPSPPAPNPSQHQSLSQ